MHLLRRAPRLDGFYLSLGLATSLVGGACARGTSLAARAVDPGGAADSTAHAGGGGSTPGPSGGGSGGGAGGSGGGASNPNAGPSGGDANGPSHAGGNTTFSPTDFANAYTYRGRFDFTDPAGPRYAWPNSAVGATFTGTSLSIRLAEPVPTLYNQAPVNNTYDVFVDQRPRQLIATGPGTQTYAVAQDLPAGAHTMWLTKRTEANIGRGQFGGLVLAADGTLLAPPKARTHVMEFVGDSSSSGYGNDGNFPVWNGCTFSVATADSTIAYPAVSAQLLDADFQNLAFAGKGITRNLAAVDQLTMPIIYALWDPRDTATSYTGGGPAAEVTLLNIGGNDWADNGTTVSTPPDLGAFTQGYLKLLQQVRARSPKTSIFVALTADAHGPDRLSMSAALKGVVAAAAAQGIGDVSYFEFPENTGALGFGCDGHPSPAMSASMAAQVVAAVKGAKGW